MENTIPQITLDSAFAHVFRNPIKGHNASEYLTRHNGENYWFIPTKVVVDEFKRVIGDKWDLKKCMSMKSPVGMDLLETKINISGKYLVASGGLCPSGVKLFEIVGKSLEEYINEVEE